VVGYSEVHIQQQEKTPFPVDEERPKKGKNKKRNKTSPPLLRKNDTQEESVKDQQQSIRTLKSDITGAAHSLSQVRHFEYSKLFFDAGNS